MSDEIAKVIDEKARSRTLEYFDGDEIDEQNPAFRCRYRIEREAVYGSTNPWRSKVG